MSRARIGKGASVFLGCCVLAGLCACGPDSPPSSPAGSTVEAMCLAQRQVLADAGLACHHLMTFNSDGNEGIDTSWYLLFRLSEAACAGIGQAVGIAEAAGTVTVDFDAWQACLDGLKGLPGCGAFFGSPGQAPDPRSPLFGGCGIAFVGHVGQGGTCRHSIECVDGFYCSPAPKSGCLGICKAWLQTGDACDTDDSCDPATSGCRWHECVAIAHVGEPCSTTRICEPGSMCDSFETSGAGVAGPPTCMPLELATGNPAPCGLSGNSYRFCPAGQSCWFPAHTTEGTCLTGLAEGTACATPGPPCGAGLVCIAKTCVKGFLQGDACVDKFLERQCAAPLQCISGRCVGIASLDDGAACESYAYCRSRLCKDGTCQPLSVLGDDAVCVLHW